MKLSTYLAAIEIKSLSRITAAMKGLLVLCFLSSTFTTQTKEQRFFKPISRAFYKQASHTPEKYPWHVMITSVKCSGVYVYERWVLTSAFCVQALEKRYSSVGLFSSGRASNNDRATVFIRVGKHYTDFETPGSDSVPVLETFVYPKYNANRSIANLGLLYLARNVMLPNGQRVSPIKLPGIKLINSLRHPTNRSAKVTGWGHNSFGRETPFRTLQGDTVSIARVCLQRFVDGKFHRELLDKSWCAVAGTRGMCSIDQGSPLIIRRNHSWVLIGVYSSGKSCVTGKHATLFSRVDFKALKWMQKLFSVGGEA